MITEKIQGIGPLRPDADKQSSLVGCLTEALWYYADGRPYEELIAASGCAFLFCASKQTGCPAEWIERCPDTALETASRAAGISLEYRELPADCADTSPEWAHLRSSLTVALEERRPVLARGGWAEQAVNDWGVLTGMDSSGLPAGYCWSGPGAALQTLCRPPAQLVFFGREIARPGARNLTIEILRNAIGTLDGTRSGHVTQGRSWLIGPDALTCWAERIEQPGPCPDCSTNGCTNGCTALLAAHYCSSRDWAGRFMRDTAALRLGAVRPARALGREFQTLSEGVARAREPAALAAAVRDAAALERSLGARLGELINA